MAVEGGEQKVRPKPWGNGPLGLGGTFIHKGQGLIAFKKLLLLS